MTYQPTLAPPAAGEAGDDQVTRVVLCDLQATLVEHNGRPWYLPPDLSIERYRPWLVDVLGDWQDSGQHIALVTVRDVQYRQATLDAIAEQTGRWQPDSAWFRDQPRLKAAQWKHHVLVTHLIPRFGEEPSRYYALESNHETTAMYRRHGIHAIRQQELRRSYSR